MRAVKARRLRKEALARAAALTTQERVIIERRRQQARRKRSRVKVASSARYQHRGFAMAYVPRCFETTKGHGDVCMAVLSKREVAAGHVRCVLHRENA